jgi:hypothetical protein
MSRDLIFSSSILEKDHIYTKREDRQQERGRGYRRARDEIDRPHAPLF